MGVALLFIDGVGIGENEPGKNPLARQPFLLSRFLDGNGTALPDGGLARPLDATFGVDGRPQSASNQTALLTGLPAPRLLGEHVPGFPNSKLRELLKQHSIVKALAHVGAGSDFVNCYPAGYLDALGLSRRPSAAPDLQLAPRIARRIRPSATTLAMTYGNVALRTLDDARAGLGLTHDIFGHFARARGFDVPCRSPEEAADIFWSLARTQQFTLFEHYQADEAGHAQDFAKAHEALATFDAFARAVVERRPEDQAVLITSDHGNVEDLSSKQHTRHPVPLLAFGVEECLLHDTENVADVGRLILRLNKTAREDAA